MAHPETATEPPPEMAGDHSGRINDIDDEQAHSNKRPREEGDEKEYRPSSRPQQQHERGYSRVDSVDSFGRARGSSVWEKIRAPNDVEDVRRNRPSSEQDPVRCAECHSKNHPRDSICTRCGANLKPTTPHDSDEYRRSLEEDGRQHQYGRDRSFSNASSAYTEHGRNGNERSKDYEDDDDGHYGYTAFRHEEDRQRGGYTRDGRRRSRKEHRRTSSRGGEPSRQCSEWPPSFESGGAAYVFDARSAFFYEAASDFFYDPKTKLYFSNKKQMYFQHVPGKHPPYEQLLPEQNNQPTSAMPGSSSAGELPTEAIMMATDSTLNHPAASKVEKKNKIMISIKKKPSSTIVSDQRDRTTQVKPKKTMNDLPINFKKSGTVSSSTLNDPLALPQKVKKQHDADIAKWSRLGKEMRSDGDDVSMKKEAAVDKTLSSHDATTRPAPPQTSKPLSKGKEVKKTASGQPICLLCKRKFANMDKLRQHEQISKLHKDNLAKKKKAAADEAKKAATTTTQSQTVSGAVEYRDRAKERRGMFESVGNAPPMNTAVQLGPSLTQPRNVVETQVVRPEEHLGDSNIGNKLLQKLGWKTGQSLGRKQAQNSAATDEEVGASNRNNDATQYLQQDWERIETMASSSSTGGTNNNAGRGTRGNHQAGIGGDATKHNYYGST